MKTFSLMSLLVLACIGCPPLLAQDAGRDDTVKLPGADVVGNRELPLGLDIVPWRPAASGEVKEGPTQLLDVPLEPIDPAVFRRELSIYQSSQKP